MPAEESGLVSISMFLGRLIYISAAFLVPRGTAYVRKYVSATAGRQPTQIHA
jgi:hypothetical protein